MIFMRGACLPLEGILSYSEAITDDERQIAPTTPMADDTPQHTVEESKQILKEIEIENIESNVASALELKTKYLSQAPPPPTTLPLAEQSTDTGGEEADYGA